MEGIKCLWIFFRGGIGGKGVSVLVRIMGVTRVIFRVVRGVRAYFGFFKGEEVR